MFPFEKTRSVRKTGHERKFVLKFAPTEISDESGAECEKPKAEILQINLK
jgi:hypothetical protein